MTKHPTYIRAMDEGHTAIVTNLPREDEGNTALMVNPKASASILIDSAHARASRIEGITRLFHFLQQDALSEIPEDVISDLGCTLNGMAHDVVRLLEAAQVAHPKQIKTEEILHSYRQTVEAAEALIRSINAADLKRVPVAVAERGAIDDAVMEMMGHCDAARDDFLGRAGS